MKFCLKTRAKQRQEEILTLTLSQRLPQQLQEPCTVTCHVEVSAQADYYLVKNDVKGLLAVTCQRCLEPFPTNYHHKSIVAICRDDIVANRLMSDYDCIVSSTDTVDMVELLTDELHLFVPEKHEDVAACDATMQALIGMIL